MALMYVFNEEEIIAIERTRKENKNKREEARLKTLELRATGATAKEVSEETGGHHASVTRLDAKYRDHGLEAI